MPITMVEKVDSRPTTGGPSANTERRYLLRGTSDEAVALAYAEANTPTELGGLVRQPIKVETDAVDTFTDTGLWLVTVPYGVIEQKEVGDSTFSFDTSGGTQHITQSKQTVIRGGAITAPDFKGAINVRQNGTDINVDGVDIVVPVYTWTETHYLSDAVVTPAYRAILFNLTGKVNDASFKNTARGETLFMGASGAKRGNEDWEISYRFSASPNATNLTIGDITGIPKEGWQYLWVFYETVEDTTAKRMVQQPAAVYVEQVYDYGNFAQLEIGT